MIFNTGGLDIPYEIVINRRLKFARIAIGLDGMKISLPRKMSNRDIERLLETKESWIYGHYMKIKPALDRIHDYSRYVLYKGDFYNKTIYLGDKNFVDFGGNEFNIYIDTVLNDPEKDKKAAVLLKEWYINSSREVINKRLIYYRRIINVSYNAVKIKDQRSRWGSCSDKRNLNFNWRLIMMPQQVMDYVIIHELCHLKHLNHSKDFWNMVYRYMPDYKKSIEWLKENAELLQIH